MKICEICGEKKSVNPWQSKLATLCQSPTTFLKSVANKKNEAELRGIKPKEIK